MTERIYDYDSHVMTFSARVLSCTPKDDAFDIVLDRSAFFPGGGGQDADTGTLDGTPLLTIFEENEIIHHVSPTAMEPGRIVEGCLDREARLGNMQQHSGEHVLCAVLHNRYGVDNVGFHMGSKEMTLDVNGVFGAEELFAAEVEANRIVRDDRPITISYPTAAELETLEYRSKKELTGTVRIVTIEETDRCACCAPHVMHTGEIGLIKILRFERYKGGTRVYFLCGLKALAMMRMYQEQVHRIDTLLSAVPEDTLAAVEKALAQTNALKEQRVAAERRLIQVLADQAPTGSDPLVLFESFADEIMARTYVNLLTARRDGPVCLFISRNEEKTVFRYILAIREGSVRSLCKEMNAALSGRGGGSDAMAQGTANATESEILTFFTKQ